MKSSVLYICLLVAVVIFAAKIFFAQPERRDDGRPQSSDQISLIYHQAQVVPVKYRPLMKR